MGGVDVSLETYLDRTVIRCLAINVPCSEFCKYEWIVTIMGTGVRMEVLDGGSKCRTGDHDVVISRIVKLSRRGRVILGTLIE